MRVQIATTEVDFAALQVPWRRLHVLVGGTVFQSHAWLLTWWNTFGDGVALRLFTAWEGERLVGVVPCFTLRHSFPPLRSLRFLGEYSALGEYLPLVAPGFEGPVAAEAAMFLREELLTRRSHCIDFHHFPASDPPLKLMLEALERTGCVVHLTPQSLPRIYMNAPADAATYRRSLSYNQRAFLNRRERVLAKRGAVIESLERKDVLGGYEDLVRLHTIRWSEKGEPGLFRARERFERFHRAVLEQLAPEGHARLYFYSRDGTRFSGLLVFHQHGTWCLYLNGRDPQHSLSHLSPGSILMARAIRDAIADGARAIDMLEGLHQYKLRLGGRLEWYGRATVHLPGLRGTRGRTFATLVRFRDAQRVRARERSRIPGGRRSPKSRTTD